MVTVIIRVFWMIVLVMVRLKKNKQKKTWGKKNENKKQGLKKKLNGYLW